MAETFEQVPFSGAEFADNPEPRCPCLLLLDNSGSMRGAPISELNEGLKVYSVKPWQATVSLQKGLKSELLLLDP
jgi:hypothetical protein